MISEDLMDLLEAVHGTKEWLQDFLVNFLEDAGLEEEVTCNEIIRCYMKLNKTFDDVEKQLIKKSIYNTLLESRLISPPIDRGWLTEE